METTHCKWLNQFVQTYFEPLVALRCQSSENPVTEKKTDMKEKSEDCHWKTQPNPRKYQKIKVLYINVI